MMLSVTVILQAKSVMLIASSSQVNRVQSLLLNYLTALLRSHGSGDFTLVYYQMGELEYISVSDFVIRTLPLTLSILLHFNIICNNLTLQNWNN